MKFSTGQTVTILNTEYKPTGTAVIRNYEEGSHRYEVEFKYPDNDQPAKIYIPEERLILFSA